MRSGLILSLLVLVVSMRLMAVEFPLQGPSLTGGKGAVDPVANKKPVVLVFWASWCASCVREMPALQKFHTASSSKADLISCTIDTEADNAKKCVAKQQLTYPVILDGEMKIADCFTVDETPTMILLGANGKVLARGRSLEQLSKALSELGVKTTR